MKRIAVLMGAVCLVLLGSNAFAQERGFVRGLGGVTFGTAENDAVFGGSVGVNVGRVVQIVGEAGRFQNVLSEDAQDDLNDLAGFLSSQIGARVSLDVTVPAFYVTGGARLIAPAGARVRPFVEGGVGIARLTFNVDASVAGIDISDEVKREAVGDEDNETDFLLTFGGGLLIPLGSSLGVEAGYRYGRIFTGDDGGDSGLNINAVYGAVSFRF